MPRYNVERFRHFFIGTFISNLFLELNFLRQRRQSDPDAGNFSRPEPPLWLAEAICGIPLYQACHWPRRQSHRWPTASC
jgi:hypothetical protein